MNKLQIAILSFASAGLVMTGCGDDAMTVTDSGTDTGVNPDTGVEPDTGINPDAGIEFPAAPTLGAQIDRTGRPAISTALLSTFEADDAVKGAAKDEYNANADPSTWGAAYSDAFAGSLAILDSLDGTCGNQLLADADDDTPARYAGLAGALAGDMLSLQSNPASGSCDGGVYLGVEAETLGVLGEGEGGCGGRDPNNDVIDRSYSVLAAGILTGVDDTITEDAANHDPDVFPFLADPS